jgi:hypothetical protein
MSIDEPIQFKVFVVVAKGIDQLLGNLSHYSRLIINFATFTITQYDNVKCKFFVFFIGGPQCVCYSFVFVAHFEYLRDVLIRTQRAAVASRRYPSPYPT